ncbi:thiol:disulfide interchange protein DsbC [Candidatus Magnetoovum chiemensis]|nr:thiol:disulfide interchange protein DsbC [Candidatus Magnetoovum chiemensis]
MLSSCKKIFLTGSLILTLTTNGFAFGGCEEDCTKCHSLNKEEARELVKDLFKSNPFEVENVQMSPSKGLWEVTIKTDKGKGVTYIDYAKKHLVLGKIIDISSKTDLTKQKLISLNKVDIFLIPLKNAIIMGDKDAQKRLILLTDPDCPFCKKLHSELKTVIEKRKDVAVYIILYPLTKIHPNSYKKSQSILCDKSLKLLEDAFDGKELPEPKCGTEILDENIKTAETLGFTGTPIIILPDGRHIDGFAKADDIIDMIGKDETSNSK